MGKSNSLQEVEGRKEEKSKGGTHTVTPHMRKRERESFPRV